jgi:hypothetical protein
VDDEAHEPFIVSSDGLGFVGELSEGHSAGANANVRNVLHPASALQDTLSVMQAFGAKHGLELHGGVEKDSNGLENLNVYLARGYSYWWGDDLDLWLTSNPHLQGKTYLGGISKKPWTKTDLEMAHDLLAALAPLQCAAET